MRIHTGMEGFFWANLEDKSYHSPRVWVCLKVLQDEAAKLGSSDTTARGSGILRLSDDSHRVLILGVGVTRILLLYLGGPATQQ